MVAGLGLFVAGTCRAGVAPPGGAGDPGNAPPAVDRGAIRLFQRFVEDAAIAPGGWMEAIYVYENLENGDRHFLGPNLAFSVSRQFEAGLRVGWRSINPDSGAAESGTSDIDLFLKYRFPGERHRFAAGVLVKAPTADETQGLGTGKTDAEMFGAYRADLDAVTLVASAALRYNGATDPPLPETRDTLLIGTALIMPASPRISLVIEGTWESERIEGSGGDGRLTLGVQSFGPARKGGFRAAAAFPLSDGAPDLGLIAGLFLTY